MTFNPEKFIPLHKNKSDVQWATLCPNRRSTQGRRLKVHKNRGHALSAFREHMGDAAALYRLMPGSDQWELVEAVENYARNRPNTCSVCEKELDRYAWSSIWVGPPDYPQLAVVCPEFDTPAKYRVHVEAHAVEGDARLAMGVIEDAILSAQIEEAAEAMTIEDQIESFSLT